MNGKNSPMSIFALASWICATEALERDRRWTPSTVLDQQFFHHARRDNPTSTPNLTINLASLPPCLKSGIIHGNLTISCSPVLGPSCSTGTEDNCTKIEVTSRCFCALPAPLADEQDCTWLDWILAENWYSEQCPDVKPVNFSGAPACGRDCIKERLPHEGCVTSGKNCFCARKRLFGCTAHCSGSENHTFLNWVSSVCGLTDANSWSVRRNATTNDPTAAIGSFRPLHWYEILPLTVACLSVFAALVSYVLMSLAETRSERLEEKVVEEDQVELLAMHTNG